MKDFGYEYMNVLNHMERDYMKENDIDRMSDDVKKVMSLVYLEKFNDWSDNWSMKEPVLDDKEKKDWFEFHKKMVQMVIDYLNSHPELKNIIEEEKKKVIEFWKQKIGDDVKLPYPDINFNLGIDMLDESVSEGEWVPSTDSGMSLRVAENTVLSSM